MTEQEELELREQVQQGHEAKIALKVVDKFLVEQRACIFGRLETCELNKFTDLLIPDIYLRVLRLFENSVKYWIDKGEIAEKELNENA